MDACQYVSDRVGLPYSDELHCWELVRQAQRDLLGRSVPTIDVADTLNTLALAKQFKGHREHANWRRQTSPVHGAIVLMSKPGRVSAIHCGIFLDIECGGVLHTDVEHGVTFDSIAELGLRNWVLEFYTPR